METWSVVPAFTEKGFMSTRPAPDPYVLCLVPQVQIHKAQIQDSAKRIHKAGCNRLFPGSLFSLLYLFA